MFVLNCVENEGRLLDFRRTPVGIEKLSDESGLATVQILAFEDMRTEKACEECEAGSA